VFATTALDKLVQHGEVDRAEARWIFPASPDEPVVRTLYRVQQ
jgi:hypothetical protein